MIDFNDTPKGYCPRGTFGPSGACWERWDGLQVILTTAPHGDGHEWAHLSISRPMRIPSYRDLTEAKDLFLGPDAKAIMVLPPRREHVNIHPFCLHLYARLDGDSLPDFTEGSGSI